MGTPKDRVSTERPTGTLNESNYPVIVYAVFVSELFTLNLVQEKTT